MIVETEAYYGEKDPALAIMAEVPIGNNVHKYWMFNIVAHYPNEVGAVLIRAVEPLNGIEYMKKRRRTQDIYQITSGPGKLTTAFKIDKSLNELDITSEESQIHVFNYETDFKISSSKRIGVKKDLTQNMRFFIRNNKYVSQ